MLVSGACMGDGVGVIAGCMVAGRGGLHGVLAELWLLAEAIAVAV